MIFLNLVFTGVFKNSAIAGRICYISKLFVNKKWLLLQLEKNEATGVKMILSKLLLIKYILSRLFFAPQAQKTSPSQKQFP